MMRLCSCLEVVVRSVALGVLVALMLSGCITQDSNFTAAGSWRIDRRIDRITAAPVAGASVTTFNSSHSGEFGTRPASVQLTCFESQPIVRFAFEFKIGSDKNTILGYRFDDKPGRDNVDSRVLFGNQVIVIENRPAVAQFVADLAGSRLLFVRLRSLNGGRTAAEFKVDGNDAAVQAAYADCPLTPEPPTRRTS
jgi:hypothetical protein